MEALMAERGLMIMPRVRCLIKDNENAGGDNDKAAFGPLGVDGRRGAKVSVL
jgi:hypothetical protein